VQSVLCICTPPDSGLIPAKTVLFALCSQIFCDFFNLALPLLPTFFSCFCINHNVLLVVGVVAFFNTENGYYVFFTLDRPSPSNFDFLAQLIRYGCAALQELQKEPIMIKF
jgi:hypothetical protein